MADGLFFPQVSTDPAYIHANRGGQAVAASVVLLVLPTLAVALRLLSRWISRAGYWWDDLIIILAMIFTWGPNIIILVETHNGLGRHLSTLPTADIFKLFKELYAFEFTYTLGISCVKYSILLFQYRIFPIVQFRRILMGVLIFCICLTISCILTCIFQCVPIHDFWDTLNGELKTKNSGTCINVIQYFLVAGGIHSVTDFVLLAMPIPILWRLKAGRTQKLILTGIFTMGLVVCAVSVIRLVVLSRLNQSDVSWNYIPVAIWTAAEPSIAVVSACLPSLRPLFVRLVWGGNYRPKRSSSSWSGAYHWKDNSITHEGSFNRLHDSLTGEPGNWQHNVAVYAGREVGKDEYDLGVQTAEADETPANRIRAKTTVVLTISERVEWRDDIF